jgi:hypothetical protein
MLVKCTQIADDFIANRMPYVPGIDPNVLANIPWVLAKINENYENGFPHTRLGIIFLGKLDSMIKTNLIQTLIHEKVHVYQRMYPKLFSILNG